MCPFIHLLRVSVQLFLPFSSTTLPLYLLPFYSLCPLGLTNAAEEELTGDRETKVASLRPGDTQARIKEQERRRSLMNASAEPLENLSSSSLSCWSQRPTGVHDAIFILLLCLLTWG